MRIYSLKLEGAVILSVPGIGVVTGAELYAEMGDISDFEHAGQLIKMAGTNPIVKQSGGKKPSYFCISKQGRRTFRNIAYQVGKSLAVNNPEMKHQIFSLKGPWKASPPSVCSLRKPNDSFSLFNDSKPHIISYGSRELYFSK